MQAIAVHDRDAGLAGLCSADLPSPHAAENDVILRVHAAGFTCGELAWEGTWTDRAGHDRVIGTADLSQHLDALTSIFREAVPAADVRRASSKEQLRAEIEPDLPILYFLCHGDRVNNATVLTVGERDGITASDLNGWIMEARRARGRRMWSAPTPLVFLNACGSLAIEPRDLGDYVTCLIRNAHAVGLIGTEARVEPRQAMAFAESFFDRLLTARTTVADALHRARMECLARANLLGLYYSAYGFADLYPIVPARRRPVDPPDT